MSSASVNKRQADRFRFLQHVYDEVNASLFAPIGVEQVGTAIGITPDEADNIAVYLVEKNLLKWASIGAVMLSEYGVDEVEAALREPDRPTSYFPPVNIMIIGTASQSQIQQGTTGSSQSMTVGSTERENITSVLAQVKELLSNVTLSPQQRADVAGNIATVEAQLSTSRPNRGVIRHALTVIQEIIAPFAAAATIGTAIAKLVTALAGS